MTTPKAPQRHPALFNGAPVLLALGALGYLTLPFEPGASISIAVLALAIIALTGLCLTRHRLARPCLAGILLLAGGFLDAREATWRQPPMPALPRHAVLLRGTIATLATTAPRENRPATRHLTLRAARIDSGVDIGMPPMTRHLRITLRPDDTTPLAPGDTVRLRALLRPPPWPAFPGARDLQEEAWFSGLAGYGRALGPVTRLAHPGGTPITRWRDAATHQIAHTLPGQTGAIAAALLVGHGERIDTTTRQEFAASGLAHLLAVAGLHLGLVMATVMAIARALLALSRHAADHWPCKEIAAIIALGVGIGYVLLTGVHLPAQRALGMAALATLALVTSRRVLSLRALAIVGCVLLIVTPHNVRDLSFQMSFAAVMALIAGYDALRGPLKRLHGPEASTGRRLLGQIGALALTSLLAGGATLAVSMAYFDRVQPWFVIANLLAVPLAGLWIVPAGMLALLLMPCHAAGGALIVMGWGIHIIMRLAHAVAMLPLAQISVPAMPGWGLFLYMTGLCALCLIPTRLRLAGIVPILLAFLTPWLTPRPTVLVAPDAGAIAVREREALAFGPMDGRDRLVEAEWLQALHLRRRTLSDCVAGLCEAETPHGRILLRPHDPQDGREPPPAEACAGSTLFVSQSPARTACPGLPMIDRFAVWRNGAYAVYPRKAGWALISDRSWRGDRPWVPAIGSRGQPNLPMAQAE